jgi:hypothetical protein
VCVGPGPVPGGLAPRDVLLVLMQSKPPNPRTQIQPTKCTLSNDACFRRALAPTRRRIARPAAAASYLQTAGHRFLAASFGIFLLPVLCFGAYFVRGGRRSKHGGPVPGLGLVWPAHGGQNGAQTCRPPPAASTVTTEGESRARRTNPLEKPPSSFCS